MSLFKKSKLYTFEVVGLSFYQEAQQNVNLKKPLSVELIEEPDNPHDKNAIMVCVNRNKIGHVPANKCKYVKEILRNGIIKHIGISLKYSDTSWVSAKVSIDYKG